MERQVNFVLSDDDMIIVMNEQKGETKSGSKKLFNKILSFFSFKKKQQAEAIKDERIGVDTIMSWDDKNLSIKVGNVKGSYPWQLFYGYSEYPSFLALYISETKFHILPKRVISQTQLQDLLTILKNAMKHIQVQNK